MHARAASLASRLARSIARRPLAALATAGVIAVGLYVIGYPWLVSRYPPITDFPFHVANSSVLRHYLDPAWGFREQFTLEPVRQPYLSMYALAALFMLAAPPVAATKLAGALMLALVPAGLAVLLRGMHKSPLLAVLSLPLVWCDLTHWGFLNFMGALGLFAMSVGLTLLLLERPSRARQVQLALCLLAGFFTHVFRYPFALAAVAGTAVVMYPATRRLRPVLAPLLPAAALFALWMLARDESPPLDLRTLRLDPGRLHEARGYLFEEFPGREQATLVAGAARAALAVSLASLLVRGAAWLAGERRAARVSRPLAWSTGACLAVASCAAVFFAMYLALPMYIGLWWYVYPRELVAALYVGLALTPDLPRGDLVRLPLVAVLCLAAGRLGFFTARSYAAFDAQTEDFYRITRALPQAPRLAYLVFDHAGALRRTTPFLHLPAYVQAERGGWLSFHFANFGHSPVRYREGGVVPPAVPVRFEWNPHQFDVRGQGRFFDWFLVRKGEPPDALFRGDHSITRVAQVGRWWLYRRAGAAGGGGVP